MLIKSVIPLLLVLLLLFLFACAEKIAEPVRELPDLASPGAKILLKKCAGCHGAPQPDVHMAKMWPAVLHRMQNRLTMKAYDPLTEKEFEVLLSYLQKHSRLDTQ